MFKSLRIFAGLVISLSLLVCLTAAFAQQAAPAGGGRLSAESSATAWVVEAKVVARQLKLDDEKTGKLVEAYKAARVSHREAVTAKVGEGGRMDRDNFAVIQEVTKAERTKLETALKGFLSEEQVGKALATLGTFNRRWDQLVTVLGGMGLGDKEAQAMDLVAAYVAESGAMTWGAMSDADREAFRAKSQQIREKLDADMGKVLTAEQLAKWKESTTRRRGR